ncbi:MAG: outer membrane lipoprotein carrier protein LolA [Polyangiaceae bacterium]|nr:outer membrane lipoprotein carrier protein LolA [Polyangiaceae bacterium]
MRLSVLVLSALPLLGLSLASAPEASADGAPAAAAAPTATAQQVVDKVQAFYDKTTSFQADFEQEFTATLHNKKTNSAGTVTFVKPGKMSWRYSSPAGNRIVSNGTKLRVYEQANQQMFESPVDKAQYPAALSFLTGQGKLWDTFNFELKTGEEMKFPGGYVLIGTPKAPSPAYKKVLFYVDGATYQVRRVMILDNQGSKNRFDFNKPRVNTPVADSEFVFEPPPNTSIVKP